MSDREKWISGLESMGEHIYFGTQITNAEYVNLMEVVKYLKRMRPVKVQMLNGKPHCGCCRISIDRKTLYCPRCGKGVKWE